VGVAAFSGIFPWPVGWTGWLRVFSAPKQSPRPPQRQYPAEAYGAYANRWAESALKEKDEEIQRFESLYSDRVVVACQ